VKRGRGEEEKIHRPERCSGFFIPINAVFFNAEVAEFAEKI